MMFIFFKFFLSLFDQALRETLHITTEYLTIKEWVVMANSKVDALEAKNSMLRKELITTMDSGNKMKEQVKTLANDLKAKRLLTEQKDEHLQAAKRKASVARENVMQTFQLTDKYNGVLLSWYFKGFELLMRYLEKHNPGMDLENLDFEAVDKKIEADESNVTKDVATEGDVNEGDGDGQADPVA